MFNTVAETYLTYTATSLGDGSGVGLVAQVASEAETRCYSLHVKAEERKLVVYFRSQRSSEVWETLDFGWEAHSPVAWSPKKGENDRPYPDHEADSKIITRPARRIIPFPIREYYRY